MRCSSDHNRLTSEHRRLSTHLPLLAIRSAVRLARSDVGAGLAGVKSTSFATSRLRDFTTIFFDQGKGCQISEGALQSLLVQLSVPILGMRRLPTEIERGKEVECYLRILTNELGYSVGH